MRAEVVLEATVEVTVAVTVATTMEAMYHRVLIREIAASESVTVTILVVVVLLLLPVPLVVIVMVGSASILLVQPRVGCKTPTTSPPRSNGSLTVFSPKLHAPAPQTSLPKLLRAPQQRSTTAS